MANPQSLLSKRGRSDVILPSGWQTDWGSGKKIKGRVGTIVINKEGWLSPELC